MLGHSRAQLSAVSTRRTPSTWARRPVLPIQAATKGFGAPAKLDKSQTCPCGSGVVYRECCQPIHTKQTTAQSAETQLKARFSAYIKGEEDYLVSTFAPSYLKAKYPDMSEADAQAQLRRDVRMSCNSYTYSKLKVGKVEAGASADEALIEFKYETVRKTAESRMGSRIARAKAEPVERNMDGSVKVYTNSERSRFVKDPATGVWALAESTILE